MSAFKKAQKSRQKPHRERHQPASRQHLGILEKKSDYKIRARNFHNKEKQLKALRKKALERNPDEFYHKMINRKLQDGQHFLDNKRSEDSMTEAQKKLMASQDINYVQMKLQMERKKLEKLSERLDLDEKPKNKRIIFVDSEKEAKRLKLSPDQTPKILPLPQELQEQRDKLRREIEKRRLREKELSVIYEKMLTRRQLTNSSVTRTKVSEETKSSAAIYKRKAVRKR